MTPFRRGFSFQCRKCLRRRCRGAFQPPGETGSRQGAVSTGDAPPILFLSAPKRERAAPGVREKGAGRAPVQWPSARTGVGVPVPAPIWPCLRARYALLRFPRLPSRGGWCGSCRGARTHLTSFSFRAFRFATRYPGGRRGLCFRADVHIRPLHQFPRGTASGSEKRSNSMR